MDYAEETTEKRKTLEIEKEETEELKLKYKVRTVSLSVQLAGCYLGAVLFPSL